MIRPKENIIQKHLTRDIVLYLLLFFTLALTMINLGTIIFQLVNIYFPDPILSEDPDVFKVRLRWALASLIVAFPAYAWLNIFLQRDLRKYAEKKESPLRKAIIYIVLGIATVVIIVNLISLIFSFLQGELTLRVGLKILCLLFLSGIVLVYYLYEAQRNPVQKKLFSILFLEIFMIFFVFFAAMAGIFAAGLPQNQRFVRLDEKRVSDLQYISSSIENYYRANKNLPANLSHLKEVSNLKDPATGVPYEYRIVAKDKYELCAVFDTSTLEKKKYYDLQSDVQNKWFHDRGRYCFEKTIMSAD